MRHDVLQNAEKYTKVHKGKHLRHRVVTVLAGVVVFCTTYALILPAITLEKKCDIPEHTHTDACYAQVTLVEKRVPVCSAKTLEIHQHTADCYDANGNPTCGYADFVVHSHDSRCYDETGNLWCPLSEIEVHRHTAGCYTLPEVHTHAKGCYTSVRGNLVCGQHVHTDACYTETAVLACGLEESEEHQHDENCYETSRELSCGIDSDHSHTDACYEWEQVLSCDLPTDSAEDAQPVLVCTKPEIVRHRHTPACFDADGNLICGQPQILEHRHSGACFEAVAEPVDTGTLTCTDTAHVHTARCYGTRELVCGQEEHTHSKACTADVETAEIWEQTFAGLTLTGNCRQDAVSIAQTQLGYTESTKNYMVAEDGKTVKGYTRYGAWYGDPYADWDTMFLTFCLHYAGVEDVPMDADCGSWATAWADGFVPAQSHEAAAGDLVFFDRDGDGAADHAGLVTEVADSGFTAIEGDAEDAVRLLSYGADDSTILGYVNLPEGAEEFTLTAQTETGIMVTITGDSASLPYPAREITVTVKEVTDEGIIAIRDRLLGEEAAEPEQSFLLDITLWHGEEEIEPTGPVTVTFSGLDTEGLYPQIYHIDTEAQTATDMEAEKEENGDVTVATDHFSFYEVQVLSFQGLSGYIGNAFSNGGDFKLSGLAWTEQDGKKANLTISKNTTIDLNGNTLSISEAGQWFEVKKGATLTIIDSAVVSDEPSYPGGTLYGKKASLDDNTLTYYITKSKVSPTGTEEKLEKHVVTLSSVGQIQYKDNKDYSAQVVLVNEGTLKIQGGLLRNNKGGHVVCVINSGTLNISGGYLVGGGRDGMPCGGGVYSDGTVNMSGGVIAANRADAGGGIYVNSGTLTISGGAVAGNWVNDGHNSGGGIYVANDSTLNLSGGYVTNNDKNTCSCCQNDTNNEHGGGGIALADRSTMKMTGGYVTGNHSGLAGGGIYAGFWGGSVEFEMSGGTIASNCASLGEGGGLRIGGGTKGVLSVPVTDTGERGYITNNITNTPDDWGGGGIFVQESGNLTVINGLITDNSAGGYGGGVAACPTGKTLIVHTKGAAIYGNTDLGQKMSGGGNGKNADTEVAKRDGTFTANGHKDYFCVRRSGNDPISLVTGEMPGGGAANWTGSSDGKYVEIGKTGYATANYLFGLEAKPDQKAQKAAEDAATIIISSNHSDIHGGGIMTNGGLILGDPGETKVVTATPALDISGTKSLFKDGVKQNEELDFQFQLTDGTPTGTVTATSDAATGEFTISPNTTYSKTGTYTYTLTEVNDGEDCITYDSSEYTIQVTIAKKEVTILGVTFTSYYVDSVKVSKTGGADTTEPTHPNTFRVHFKKPDNWGTVNMYIWGWGPEYNNQWPGDTVDEDQAHPGWYMKEFDVSLGGKFSYIFNNNDSPKTEDLSCSYSPGGDLWVYANGYSTTTAPDDWNGGSSGSNVSFTGKKNSDESYSLTIHGSAFTNTSTTRLDLQIRKTDSNDDAKVLQGATFSLKKPGEKTGTEATTDKDGIATFTGIQRNTTYELNETEAPSNYMTAGPWILDVRSEDATIYPARKKSDGTLEKAGETGKPLTVSGSDPIVLTAAVSDQPLGYELPDTGGAGTVPYTMGGCALIAVYLLLYSHTKRRKKDEASS